MTFTYQYNDGKWSSEYIYSTHEALLGLTGIYNFGAKERISDPTIASRLSVGGEIFYAVLSKSPGLSTCLRYTTQSAYTGTPLTMSLLCNPLMGQISTMYSLATRASSFGSRFDFNIYSYESDLSIGCELWRSSTDTQWAEAQAQETKLNNQLATPSSPEINGSNSSAQDSDLKNEGKQNISSLSQNSSSSLNGDNDNNKGDNMNSDSEILKSLKTIIPGQDFSTSIIYSNDSNVNNERLGNKNNSTKNHRYEQKFFYFFIFLILIKFYLIVTGVIPQ